jgi:hypothetical protein
MLRTTTLSEIIKESPTSCCSLMSRRCAAQDRCDAASGWVDFCAITIKRPRESPRHIGRDECCARPSTPSYVLFVTASTANLCHEAAAVELRWRNRPEGFCYRFDFLALRDSAAAAEEEGTQAETPTSTTTHDALFDERFASYFDERSTSSFDERFASSFDKRRGEAEQAPVLNDPVSAKPLVGPAPLKTFAAPRYANSPLRPDAAKHKDFPPAVGRSAPPESTVIETPLPAKKPVFTAVARNDSTSPPDADRRTAIYDIKAHVVYLPNGDRLEAHSGLGINLDNADDVGVRGRGPTPPNVYSLALREAFPRDSCDSSHSCRRREHVWPRWTTCTSIHAWSQWPVVWMRLLEQLSGVPERFFER